MKIDIFTNYSENIGIGLELLKITPLKRVVQLHTRIANI